MAAPPLLNKNNSAVKRIMQEARELANDPSTDYSAAPLEDDIFEWHCTLRGPAGTDFEGGLYHFRIRLPAEYPFRPPSIMVLTPNGRFELNTKICISFTNYHEELWQPAWGVRTAIIGLQGFFPLKGQAAMGVGALEVPSGERKRLATLSRDWICSRCNRSNLECLPDPPQQNNTSASGSASGGQSSVETDTVPTPVEAKAEVVSSESQPVESHASVSGPESAPDNAGGPGTGTGMMQAESDDKFLHEASSSPAPSPAGASTPQQNLSGARSPPSRQAGMAPIYSSRPPPISVRPPMLLDTAICVLLVLVFALLCRRIF